MAALEHIADAGLLGGRSSASFGWMESAGGFAQCLSSDATPSLHPVSGELTATIDARFTAAGISLG